MAELALVDTHVHFWDLQNPNTHYSWLQPGWIHPILGDMLYGSEDVQQRAPRLLLHATWLEFVHPADGRTVRVESPVPFS